MTREATKNLPASIRARLLSLAQSRDEDYQRVLGRFAIERFLYRLGRSKHRDRFALKGATLFTLWTGQTHRPTKDLDLLGRGVSSNITEVEAMIREICNIQQDDGIVFAGESVEQRSVRFSAVFFCRAFQKDHSKIQVHTGIQPIIGAENGKAPVSIAPNLGIRTTDPYGPERRSSSDPWHPLLLETAWVVSYPPTMCFRPEC